MIHLGIQWPRIRCSKAYAQHQHGMLQSLCPIFPNYIFHVFQSFMLNTNVITHVLQSLLLNAKHIIDHVLKSPHPTQTFHQPCALGSIPNTKHIYTYISSTIGFRPTYKTNHHVHMQWGLLTQK